MAAAHVTREAAVTMKPPGNSWPAQPARNVEGFPVRRQVSEPLKSLDDDSFQPVEKLTALSDLRLHRAARSVQVSNSVAAPVKFEADPEKPKLTSSVLAVASLLILVDYINMNLLTPYALEMVGHLLQQPVDSPQVQRGVGWLVGVYNLSEMVFSPPWGKLSDRFGRRPIILASLGGAALAPIAFGLSNSFTMAVAVRALNGALCGSIGTTKTYVAELADKDNETHAFTVLTSCYSLGMIIGPVIGGQLQSPASWSKLLGKCWILVEYPFLLPNLVFSLFALGVWLLAYFFLIESLPSKQQRQQRQQQQQQQQQQQHLANRAGEGTGKGPRAWQVSILSYPPELLRTILALGLAVWYLFGVVQNVMLICQIPVSAQGFGLGPSTLGLLQNCAAAGLLLAQLVLYPRLVKARGFRWCTAVGVLAVLASTLPMPLYAFMSDPERFGVLRLLPLALMMVVQQTGFGFLTTTTTVFVNRFGEGLDLGEVNGWTNSFAALCRALAPIVVGNLQSWGSTWSWRGGRYLALYSTSLLAVAICALFLPVLPGRSPQLAKSTSDVSEASSEQAAGEDVSEKVEEASKAVEEP